jgi:hypothetical protein
MTSNSILTAAPQVRRIVHPNYPNPFDFPAGTPDEEVKQHFAQLQSARDYQELGPVAALGRLLGTAQSAITEKPAQEVGPQVLRNVSAWGLSPNEVTNTFETLSNRQLQQQEQEQRRVEGLANRQAQLQQMQQELQMVAEEHKFNQQMKAMEYTAKQEEARRETELQNARDEKLQANKLALEEKKAELKTPTLKEVWDPQAGVYRYQVPQAGDISKDPKAAASAAPTPKQIADFAGDLASDYVVIGPDGAPTDIDLYDAMEYAAPLLKGEPINGGGARIVRRPDSPDLVPQTDASGKTVLGPKGEGVVTKEQPAESPKEARQRAKELRDIAKTDLDDLKAKDESIQTDPEEPNYDAEALRAHKEAMKAAEDEYRAYNDAYKKALKGEDAGQSESLLR